MSRRTLIDFLLAIMAVVLAALSPVRAEAQTRQAPLRSHFQLVGGANSSHDFYVDPGATRVWLDVRQAGPTDSCSVTTPMGRALAYDTVVEELASKVDRRLSGDPLGQFQEAMYWDAPQPGRYSVGSGQEFLGFVVVDGGGEMLFWVDDPPSFKPGSYLPNAKSLRLAVGLNDANGLPLSGATVTGTVQQTAKADGSEVKAVASPLTFVPGTQVGVYTATLPSGLKSTGVYTVSITGQKDLLRRDIVTSLAAYSGLVPPHRAAGEAPPPIIEIQDPDPSTPIPYPDAAAPGTIRYAREDLADPVKPVIVFLHGWNSDTSIWDDRGTGFYGPAIDAAYRVALVGLHGDRDFMTNAAIVSQTLPVIAAHYDVRKVVIVAHSKGGVDADAALILNGSSDYVTTMMTLGTPHTGTPLADLVDEPGFSSLPFIGQFRNEAQRSMKPAAMALFRAQVNGNPRNASLDIRTFGGWDYTNVRKLEDLELLTTGSFLDAYAFVHANDGIVPYAASIRPGVGGREIFSGPSDSRTAFNHFQLREKGLYWAHIQAELLSSQWDNSPSPPSNVVAALNANGDTGSVQLTWDNHSRFAQTLRVERATDGGAFAEISPPSYTAAYTIYYDLSVPAGHTYAYRMRFGIGNTWFSSYSNTATVGFPVASPTPVATPSRPNAPSQLRAAPLSTTQIGLTWVDNSADETGFAIYRLLPSGSAYTNIATVGANVTTFTDSGLTPNTGYSYQVRALNGSLASPFSNVASTVTSMDVLGDPSFLNGSYDPTTGRVQLTWVDNSSSEDGFHVQFSYSGSAFSDLAPPTVAANVTTYVTGQLPTTGNYQFRVQATRGTTSSGWSNVASVTVTTPVPLVAPSNLTASYNATTMRIELGWTDNTTSEDAFEVQFSYSGSAFSDLAPPTVGANVTTYATGQNPPSGSYGFRVRALRGADVSPWSNVASMIK
ncbi:MAG TPA: fibronectin type III domain-containing protein [Candidatus Binatia bacterium]|jgi:pimeloyl-ACP methyl ester carboxylesterase